MCSSDPFFLAVSPDIPLFPFACFLSWSAIPNSCNFSRCLFTAMLARFNSLTQAVLLLILSCTLVQAVRVQRRATVCNGHAELCDRGYGNITFVGAHNSYAVGINDVSTNQDYDVTQQLTDGVRMLQMQAHNNNGSIQLCHTACSLYNAGNLGDYLGKVKTWMDANPNEVVSLLIVNSDNIAPAEYDAIFKAAGVDAMSYAPPTASLPQSGWPTLGSLIDSGKRLVAFLSTTADFNSVPYLIDEFSNVWETAFDVIDPTFDCNVNRTNGDPSTQMFLINHFLDKPFAGLTGVPVPFRAQANVTNSVSGPGSLGEQVSTCINDHGRNPNFLLVDFYEYGGGSVFQVAATANGVDYTPATPIATPIPETTATSSSSAALRTGEFRISQGAVYGLLAVTMSVIAGTLPVIL